MTHQKVRKLSQAIFTPILLIPEIIIMLSPLLVIFIPVFGSAAVYFIDTALLLWGSAALLSVLFGRAYCSHVCPITGVFSFVSYLSKNRGMLSFEYPKLMGRIILFLWFAAPAYVIFRNIGNFTGILPQEDLYTQLPVILYFVLFAVSGILALTYGKTSVRHYTCPFASFMIAGNRLGRKLGAPSLRFGYDKNFCKKCGVCAKKCLVNRDIPKMIHSDRLNFEECVQCASCAEVCKFSAITYGWKKNGTSL